MKEWSTQNEENIIKFSRKITKRSIKKNIQGPVTLGMEYFPLLWMFRENGFNLSLTVLHF